MTRLSHTVIIMFIQNAPIIWFCMKQNTHYVALFGSKLLAPRIFKDLTVELRYKLRMFGVILEVHVYDFCDNCGVVNNMSIMKSVLHMTHNVINYHSVCKSFTSDIL